MAACTFTARILVSLRLVVPEQVIIDQSLGPGPGTSEYTARTDEIAGVAADTYEARMGDPGAFDNSDRTIGDRRAFSWGVRYAKHLLIGGFKITEPDTFEAEEARLMNELEGYAEGAIQEASTPVVATDEDMEEV